MGKRCVSVRRGSARGGWYAGCSRARHDAGTCSNDTDPLSNDSDLPCNDGDLLTSESKPVLQRQSFRRAPKISIAQRRYRSTPREGVGHVWLVDPMLLTLEILRHYSAT